MRAASRPALPTADMIDDHEAADHVPYRAWCTSCVAGRGRSDGHHAPAHVAEATPVVVIDYGYLDKRKVLPEDAKPTPILVTRDSIYGLTTSDAMPTKGCGRHRTS